MIGDTRPTVRDEESQESLIDPSDYQMPLRGRYGRDRWIWRLSKACPKPSGPEETTKSTAEGYVHVHKHSTKQEKKLVQADD